MVNFSMHAASYFTVLEVVEALAIRSAVSLAKEEGFDHFILVSNCLSMIIQRIFPDP
jgi:hypothetical protein